jgi:hypothetical protein
MIAFSALKKAHLSRKKGGAASVRPKAVSIHQINTTKTSGVAAPFNNGSKIPW